MIEDAKQVPIDEVGARVGVQFSESGFAICPFHQDARPSLHFQNRVNRAKCYACGWSGDTIALVQQTTRKNFMDSVRFILGMAEGIEENLAQKGPSRKPDREISGWPPNERTKLIWQEFSRITRRADNLSPAWDYLQTRGIEREESLRFRIGGVQSPGKVVCELVEMGFTKEELEDSGLFPRSRKSGSNHLAFFAPSVVFTHLDPSEEIAGFSGRFIPPEPQNGLRFIKLKGYPSSPWFQRSRHPGPIVIAEGVIDAISASILLGGSIAIAPGGASCLITGELIRDASRDAGTKRFIICADDDDAGIRATESWKSEIVREEKNPEIILASPRAYCERNNLDTEGVKDWNDVLKITRRPKPDSPAAVLPSYTPLESFNGKNGLDILSRMLFPSLSSLDSIERFVTEMCKADPEKLCRDRYCSHNDTAMKMLEAGETWDTVVKWIEDELPSVSDPESRQALAWVAFKHDQSLFGVRM